MSTQVQRDRSTSVTTGVTSSGVPVAGIGAGVDGRAWSGGGMGWNLVSGTMISGGMGVSAGSARVSGNIGDSTVVSGNVGGSSVESRPGVATGAANNTEDGVGVSVGMNVDTGIVASTGDSAGVMAAMSMALLAHQLPLLSKFDGGTSADGDKETVKEWLEQFELVAGICRWDNPTRLANLVTRLQGEAYAFYKSCMP